MFCFSVSTTAPPQRQWIPLARPEAGRPAGNLSHVSTVTMDQGLSV